MIDDEAVQFSGPAQDALVIDNCSTATMSEITSGDLDQCYFAETGDTSDNMEKLTRYVVVLLSSSVLLNVSSSKVSSFVFASPPAEEEEDASPSS